MWKALYNRGLDARLSARLDGELPAAEKADLDERLVFDPSCRQRLAALLRVTELSAAALQSPPHPAAAAQRLVDRLQASTAAIPTAAAPSRSAALGPLGLAGLGLVGLGLVGLGLVGLGLVGLRRRRASR